MTPAKEISVQIGGISVKIGDLRGFVDSNVIVANGMKIKASEFEIIMVKKRIAEQARGLTDKKNL